MIGLTVVYLLTRFNVIISLLISVFLVESLEDSTNVRAQAPVMMPSNEMALTDSDEGSDVSHYRPDHWPSDTLSGKDAIRRGLKSKPCHHLSGKRQGRTTFVKAIVSNPKLSPTQILAQKLAKEALKSQKMQDAFRKLSEIKAIQKDPETNRIFHPSKIEKSVHKRHKGTKIEKRRKHTKHRRHNRKSVNSNFVRATSKKECNKIEGERAPKCQQIGRKRAADSHPNPSIYPSGSRTSPPLLTPQRDHQLFERESMIAQLMRTTTKDPSKNSSGDQGVEYSEYYSDSEKLNPPPENKVQLKLNEVTKNLRVRSVRQAAISPFLHDTLNRQQYAFRLQSTPYFSAAPFNSVRRNERVRPADNTVQTLSALRKYEPAARNAILSTGGETSFNHNLPVNGNGSKAAFYSYIKNPPSAHDAEQVISISSRPAIPDRGLYQTNQVPIAAANDYPVINPVHNNILHLIPNNIAQRYAASGIPQQRVASDTLQPVAPVDFQSDVRTVNPMVLSPNYRPDIARNKQALSYFNNNGYASNTVVRMNPSLSFVRNSNDNDMPEPLEGEPELSLNNPNTRSVLSTATSGLPASPAVLTRPFMVPPFSASGSKLEAKKASDYWPYFRGMDGLESIAPQSFLPMKSPMGDEGREAWGRSSAFEGSNINIGTMKIPELNRRMKEIGYATELPPDPGDAQKHGYTKTKTPKAMDYDLLPMSTLLQTQVTGPASVNVTSMGNETKAVASEILTKIMDELEELNLDHPKNEQKEGLPCRLTGSWVTIQAGVRIDMKVTNHSINVVLGNLIPPSTSLGLLNITWNVTGHAPFKRGGPFTLIATDNHTKTLAVFVGSCKVCQGIDTIEGLWTLSREPRDCRDFQMSTSVFNEIFRRTRLMSVIEEKYRKHEASASSTLATSKASHKPTVIERKEGPLSSKTAMEKPAIRGTEIFDRL